jgi:hypothetical protein
VNLDTSKHTAVHAEIAPTRSATPMHIVPSQFKDKESIAQAQGSAVTWEGPVAAPQRMVDYSISAFYKQWGTIESLSHMMTLSHRSSTLKKIWQDKASYPVCVTPRATVLRSHFGPPIRLLSPTRMKKLQNTPNITRYRSGCPYTAARE